MESTTVGSNNGIVLEVLNKHNYKDWSSRVETYLVANDLWDVVRQRPPPGKANAADKASWRTKDAKALHAIKISCGTEMFSFIREKKKAKTAWEVLEKKSKPHDREKKDTGCTDLHTAVMNGELHTVKELLSSMKEEDLKKKDGNDRTALDCVIVAPHAEEHWIQIVRDMVEKNREIVQVSSSPRNYIPVVRACSRNKWKMARCLFSLTPIETLLTKNGRQGALLVDVCLWRPKGFDIAWTMLQKYPWLAMAHNGFGQQPMLVLAGIRSAFPSSARLTLWQKLIYKCIRIQHNPESCIAVSKSEDNQPVEFDNPESCIAVSESEDNQPVEFDNQLVEFDNPESCIVVSEFEDNQPVEFDNPESCIAVSESEDIQHIEFENLESCIVVSESEDKPSPKKSSGAYQGLQKKLCNELMIFFRRAIMGASNLLGINPVYKMKLNHFRNQKFLSCMVKVVKNWDHLKPAELNVVRASLFKATAQGHVEFIMHMYKANEAVAQIFDDKKKSIFQYAIECRQEKIYNLIYQLKPEEKSDITHNVAKFKTNMLHSAANLSSVTHFNHIQGANLQMQRELQWFKEVESIVPSEMHEYVNISDLTARELFSKNHKQLKNEAEKSMKEIADSCMTAGALIVTIMFAVAFTVPGGTNSNTGLPMFLHKKLFKIFILSDTISLISSATSVITFLGLLTSAYAEDDFLWYLPTILMIGLSTLFISIAAMMITFTCALTIMLDGEAKLIIPVIVFATVPVVSFAVFLFPLLFGICRFTYGPSIFGKNSGIKH